MSSATIETPGAQLEKGLQQAIKVFGAMPREGARNLPVLIGLESAANAAFCRNHENVTLEAIGFLADSRRVYAMGDDIVMEISIPGSDVKRLTWLRVGRRMQHAAPAALANVFVCRHEDKLFTPPTWFVRHVFASDHLAPRLPRIEHYSSRPAFGPNYEWLSPGWHPQSRFLVHGEAIEPRESAAADSSLPIIERLPPMTRRLFQGFCFRDSADAANVLAMLMGGVLTVAISAPRPVFLVDGNQAGLGKTLLVRVIGVVLDGAEPAMMTFTQNEEELQKATIAKLRGRHLSVLLFDNAKVAGGGPINSPAIEAMSMAPEVTGRILGKSEDFARTNDFLWAITMNDTKVSPDLVSRGLPIRLAYEGRPQDRQFCDDPVDYAREHRAEILAELAGMVEVWNRAGQPVGTRRHRCQAWSEAVGGILEANGFPEFMANVDEAAESFNSDLDELADLFDACKVADGPWIDADAGDSAWTDPARRLQAAQWLRYFLNSGVLAERLLNAKEKRRQSLVGQFLSSRVDREIGVEIGGREGRATLRVEKGSGRRRSYYFEVRWTDPPCGSDRQDPETPSRQATGESAQDGARPTTDPPEDGVVGITTDF